MPRSLVAYVSTLIVFGAIDFLWLAMTKDMYKSGIGHLMLDKPNIAVAVAFYLLFVVGLVLFGVQAGLAADDWTRALVWGALFGFFCYATYDLTNWATLRGWPATIVIADLAYGTIASGVAAAAGCAIARAWGR